MRITLLSPRIALLKGDFLGSGIPYWPIELATLAAQVRSEGDDVGVLDLFGSETARLSDAGDHYLQGVPLEEFIDDDRVRQADAFVLYAISYMSHGELLAAVRRLKLARPGTPIAVLENSQAVTAYSLPRMADSFFAAGADALICGDACSNWCEIKDWLGGSRAAVPANLVTRDSSRPPRRVTAKDVRHPLPAWDLFELRNYWKLPYSHGPKTPRFLPILTSRGCPYPCDFCVVPETNDKRWRGNAAEAVVDEIIALRERFEVRDFQVEDLNPTVRHQRWEEICRLLIARAAGIRFYLVSGTKAETVRIDEVPLLAAAGCRYISISPESGSARLMKIIGKAFDHEHGLRLVAACRRHGIRTQACFLVGHPAETEADFLQSRDYLRRLVRSGLDEVAVFVVAPFAGSALHSQGRIAVDDPAALATFSAKGRAGQAALEQRRRILLRAFFAEKLRRGFDLWSQAVRAVTGRPQTKMENLPRRIVYVWGLVLRLRLGGRGR